MTHSKHTIIEELQGTVDQIISQLKNLIREGNVRRLVIKDRHGKTLFQSQLTLGVAGTAFVTALAPVLSAVTMFVLFANDVSVLVEKDTDSKEDSSSDETANSTTDPYEVKADVIEIDDDGENGHA